MARRDPWLTVMHDLQAEAEAAGLDRWSDAKINAFIAKVRRELRGR